MDSVHQTRFLEIVGSDRWLMNILHQAASLNLSQWAVAAGAVRNCIWDHLHEYTEKNYPSDIDFIFFDQDRVGPEYERFLEARLAGLVPDVSWEAVNQASVHRNNGEAAYSSIDHALSRWADPATAVGVYLDRTGVLQYYAPHGLADLMDAVIRPHLVTPGSRQVYLDRIRTKDYQARWPKVKILLPEDD